MEVKTQNNRFSSKSALLSKKDSLRVKTVNSKELYKAFISFFIRAKMVNGTVSQPFLCENLAETDTPPSKTAISNQYSLVAHRAVTTSE